MCSIGICRINIQVARFVELDNTLKPEEIELAVAGTSHKIENTKTNQRRRVFSGFSVRDGVQLLVPAVTASDPYFFGV